MTVKLSRTEIKGKWTDCYLVNNVMLFVDSSIVFWACSNNVSPPKMPLVEFVRHLQKVFLLPRLVAAKNRNSGNIKIFLSLCDYIHWISIVVGWNLYGQTCSLFFSLSTSPRMRYLSLFSWSTFEVRITQSVFFFLIGEGGGEENEWNF